MPFSPFSRRIPDAVDADAVRGLEGVAAVSYFAGLREVLGSQVPDELRSPSRSRRPPIDRFNALLSYGYGFAAHTSVMRAVLASGLEPALGFFHTPRSAAYPLVLDLMELFRVTLWDMPLMGSLNRGQWDVTADFEVTRAKVWLSEAGRKKAIGLFEDRMQETWKHPVLNYSLSYARSIELEARLLEKEWTGVPGLVARSRLRCGLGMSDAQWGLVCYDVHDPTRLRKCAKHMQAYGERIQYAVFRCWMGQREVERLRWELTELLASEDDVMLIPLCSSCVGGIVGIHGSDRPPDWTSEPERHRIV